MFMRRGVSAAVAFTLVLVIVMSSSVALFFWIGGQNGPELNEEFLRVDAYSINSTAIHLINMGAENSSSLTAMKTSMGDCSFSGPTILQPGIEETCILASPVSAGITVTVYADGIKQVKVKF